MHQEVARAHQGLSPLRPRPSGRPRRWRSGPRRRSPASTPATASTSAAVGATDTQMVVVNAAPDGARLRASPADGAVKTVLADGTRVTALGESREADGVRWHLVRETGGFKGLDGCRLPGRRPGGHTHGPGDDRAAPALVATAIPQPPQFLPTAAPPAAPTATVSAPTPASAAPPTMAPTRLPATATVRVATAAPAPPAATSVATSRPSGEANPGAGGGTSLIRPPWRCMSSVAPDQATTRRRGSGSTIGPAASSTVEPFPKTASRPTPTPEWPVTARACANRCPGAPALGTRPER